jgi:hypothetical protein
MSKRKKLFIALVGVAVLAIGSVAYATWSATGGGNGSAKAITPSAITLVVNNTAAGDLYPGGPAGALHFTATNNNPYDVQFTGYTVGTITPSNVLCDVTSGTNPVLTVDPAPGIISVAQGAPVDIDIPGVVHMDPLANDSCQGNTFTIQLTLVGGTQV